MSTDNMPKTLFGVTINEPDYVYEQFQKHQHSWKHYSKKVDGAVIKSWYCTGCKKVDAYDLDVVDRQIFAGSWEFKKAFGVDPYAALGLREPTETAEVVSG